ncbi:hypothetical protein N185_15530 [Sinorhizobium sp. GW3]|jgi:hypothetical protein|nr:hypothetical protein N182_06840 [Sinorhizobium sp. GL2]KSV76566.1 hypothetical protein N185_15530 [Sinorhizobium sp. GW3]
MRFDRLDKVGSQWVPAAAAGHELLMIFAQHPSSVREDGAQRLTGKR